MNGRRDLQGQPIDLAAALAQARVTDHAILRYLERIEGRNIDALRQAFLSPAVLQGMALDANCVVLPNLGAKLVLRGYAITTVVPIDWKVLSV